MQDFCRVRDKRTGHEYSVRTVTEHHEVLDKRAVDANGRPLPAKPKTSVAKLAAAKKAAPSGPSGVEPAEYTPKIPEEGSK